MNIHKSDSLAYLGVDFVLDVVLELPTIEESLPLLILCQFEEPILHAVLEYALQVLVLGHAYQHLPV